MLVFPGQLTQAAHKANMSVPPDPDDFDAHDYPHFAVYCASQLGVPATPGNHWRNAEIIAKISAKRIRLVTPQDLRDLGFDP